MSERERLADRLIAARGGYEEDRGHLAALKDKRTREAWLSAADAAIAWANERGIGRNAPSGPEPGRRHRGFRKALGGALIGGAIVAIASFGHDRVRVVRVGGPIGCPPAPCPPPDDDPCDRDGRR